MSSQAIRRSYLLALILLVIAAGLAGSAVSPPAGRVMLGQTAGALGWSGGQSLGMAATPAATATATAGPLAPRAAFQALQAKADGPLHASWDGVTGIPDFLTTHNATQRLPYMPTAVERGNPLLIARGFLDENRALFRLRSASDELALTRVEPDPRLGYSHVRLGQVYKGIPVYGQQLVVHMDADERIAAVNGQFTPDIDVPTQPLISKDQAHTLAIERLNEHDLTESERENVQVEVFTDRTQLMVFVDLAGKPTLTWRVTLLTHAPLGQWYVFVNARRPVVVHSLEATAHAMRRQTFTARNSTRLPGQLIADEGEMPRDQIARAAHEGAGHVYNYYWGKFQRDSIDGHGAPLVSTVNYGSRPEEAENAAWIGELQQMIYGDGGRMFRPLALGLDVVGHEFTHGIIDNTAQLIYEAQAGALNESYADIFGVLIAGSNWDVGRQVIKSPPFPLPFLRSLSDPNAGIYNPRNPLQGVGQPGHMREYANLPVSRRADNGGVHINSGIPNRAAYLVAQAVGREKAEQIFYRTLTQYLTPRANFLGAANATARAAAELYGEAEANAVRDAFGQVGINVNSSDSGPTQGREERPTTPAPAPTPAPQLPAGCTDVVTDGGFESETAWRQVVGKGNSGIIDPELPYSGARSAWLGGTDKEPLQFIYQDVRVPANATSARLTYYRNVHLEKASLLAAFAPDATFSAVAATESGDVIGAFEQIASSEGDDQWRPAEFDVTQFAGKTLRLVFSAENPKGDVSSMFVDDVALVACTTGDAPSAPATGSDNLVYIQGRVQDADTGRAIAGAQVFVMRPGITARQAAADDQITKSEVLTMGVTDGDGVYRTEAPIPRGQTYSFIVFYRGYRSILADNEVVVPPDAGNPHPVNAVMRRSR